MPRSLRIGLSARFLAYLNLPSRNSLSPHIVLPGKLDLRMCLNFRNEFASPLPSFDSKVIESYAFIMA